MIWREIMKNNPVNDVYIYHRWVLFSNVTKILPESLKKIDVVVLFYDREE